MRYTRQNLSKSILLKKKEEFDKIKSIKALSWRNAQKRLDKSTIIWNNADNKGDIKMRTMKHLSIKAMMELEEVGYYDTRKYRYAINQDNGKCYRINKELLGTTEALDPDNWVKQ